MKWTFKLGRVAGIVVYVHATFLILVGWVALDAWTPAHSAAAALEGAAFTITLFACVVVHELGHALAARHFGIATRDITLLPIGGLSRLERMPRRPVQEFWIAVAGPATSVAIAVTIAVVLFATSSLRPLPELGVAEGPFLERLMLVNVMLAVFNMLPAFPMDGGRVLRALLAMRVDYPRATRWAAAVGQAMALLFLLLGLFSSPILVLIALFIWLGAAQEAGVVQLRAAVSGVAVAEAMRIDVSTLSPDDAIETARELTVRHAQHDLPVVSGGTIVGVLTREDLLSALATRPKALVADVMHQRFETAEDTESLDVALARLEGNDCHVLPVVHAGRLVGLISMEGLGEFLRLQMAMGEATPREKSPQAACGAEKSASGPVVASR